MELLDQLAKIRIDLEELMVQEDKAIAAAVPREIQREIDDIREAFDQRNVALRAEMTRIEEECRRQALKHGDTMKGQRMMAVYSSGRVTWDDRGLQGYAAAHPEILKFRKEGKPSVSIREK